MISRSRCWGLLILFLAAVGLRAIAARWAPIDAAWSSWPQWIVGMIAGSLLPPTVALLSWSRLPDRPRWGWLAAITTTIFPSAIRAGAVGSPLLAIALVITLALIDFDSLIGSRVRTPQRASTLWPVPFLGLLAIVCAWWLIRGDSLDDGLSRTGAVAVGPGRVRIANVLLMSPASNVMWSRIESVSAVALAITSLMGAALWLPHRLSLWLLMLPPIVVGAMLTVGYADPPWRVVADPLLIVLAVGALTPLVGRPAARPSSTESPMSPREVGPSSEAAASVVYPLQAAAAARSRRRAG